MEHVHLGPGEYAVHAERNQSEYPRRITRDGPAIQRVAARTHWGFPTYLPSIHIGHFSWPGTYRPPAVYAVAAIVEEEFYAGEAFLRMGSQESVRHPSGLPDDALLSSSERLAEVIRGG